jgi:hypothetical protein
MRAAGVDRERQLLAEVREALARVGRFRSDTSEFARAFGCEVVFVRRDGREVYVSLEPGSEFGRLLAAAVGLHPALPAVRRAVQVLVAEVLEGAAMSPADRPLTCPTCGTVFRSGHRNAGDRCGHKGCDGRLIFEEDEDDV